VLEHVPLSTYLEDITFEEDQFKQGDDAKGDMNEDGRRPTVAICPGISLVVIRGCRFLEVPDSV
jgi:hypothetical protein